MVTLTQHAAAGHAGWAVASPHSTPRRSYPRDVARRSTNKIYVPHTPLVAQSQHEKPLLDADGIVQALAMCCNSAGSGPLLEGSRVLIDGPHRFLVREPRQIWSVEPRI